VAGARAPQGVVLVNGVASSDVASGDPVAVVPLDAVESVQVIATGFAAEFGPSTGGVTAINTRSGADTLKFSINSFTPRPRLADGTIEGIEAWEPNTSVRGPIAKGRAWFAQSFDYRFEKTRADTVTADAQDRRQHGFTSFTQIDAKAGAGHVLTGWVNAQQEHVDGEQLGAFTPLGTCRTWNGGSGAEPRSITRPSDCPRSKRGSTRGSRT
jgi:outer membrane receptor protein involved in Fe transport